MSTEVEVATTPHDRRVEIERFMAWARLFGAALAIGQFLAVSHFPPGVRPAGIAIGVGFAVLGVWTLGCLRRHIRPRRLKRLMLVTLGADTALLVALNLVLSYATDATTRALLLLPVLEGATKFGRRGAWSALGVAVVHEGARGFLRAQVHGLPSDIAEVTFFVGLALLVTVWAEQMSLIVRRSRRSAVEQAVAAERARRDADRLQTILLEGLAGVTTRDFDAMLAHAGDVVGFGDVSIVLRDDDGAAYVAHTLGDDVVAAGPPRYVVDFLAVADDVDGPVRHGTGDQVVVMAALPVPGSITGALVFRRPMATWRADDSMLAFLARQTGLVVQASQALSQEVALADRLIELDRVRSDFLAVASHELRTPLTSVLGFAETLAERRGGLDATSQGMAEAILRQARRMAALVEDLGTVMALDRGEVSIVARPVAVAESCRAALASVGVDGDLDADLDVVVMADPVKFEQVLTRLLENAREHAGGLGVRIEVGREAGQVAIAVCDDGPGVPEAHRERIFERFFQAADVLSHQRGTGLGVPIAREIARRMKGDLVLADSGGGARFVITLPEADPARLPATHD